MAKITRIASIGFQDPAMVRLSEQRLVSTVVRALAHGHKAGKALAVRSSEDRMFFTEEHQISDWG